MKKYLFYALGTGLVVTSMFGETTYAENNVSKVANVHEIVRFETRVVDGKVKFERVFGVLAERGSVERVHSRKETTSKANLTRPQFTTYTVVKGDTLSKIARQFNVTILDLMNWNGLTSPDVIHVGQALKIISSNEPSLPVAGDGEVVEDELNVAEMLLKDQEIIAQLSKEKKITSAPSNQGQRIYEQALQIASEQLGVPYVFAGNTPEGFDCSGFIRYVFVNAGMDLPRKSSEDYFMNDSTVVENPVPGDLIYFKHTYKPGISHMGIYLGNGEFIHAGSNGVEISKVEYDYWQKHFVTFKRFNDI